jgi:hypothetical protein
MPVKYIIQFAAATLLLLVFTFCALYEGSELLDWPSEWKYSTPFSELFNGEVQNIEDISGLDYFVYAAKFRPIFPILMVICTIYLIILLDHLLITRNYKQYSFFLAYISFVMLMIYGFTFHSTSTGVQLFHNFFLACGLLFLAAACMIYFSVFHRLNAFFRNK